MRILDHCRKLWARISGSKRRRSDEFTNYDIALFVRKLEPRMVLTTLATWDAQPLVGGLFNDANNWNPEVVPNGAEFGVEFHQNAMVSFQGISPQSNHVAVAATAAPVDVRFDLMGQTYSVQDAIVVGPPPDPSANKLTLRGGELNVSNAATIGDGGVGALRIEQAAKLTASEVNVAMNGGKGVVALEGAVDETAILNAGSVNIGIGLLQLSTDSYATIGDLHVGAGGVAP